MCIYIRIYIRFLAFFLLYMCVSYYVVVTGEIAAWIVLICFSMMGRYYKKTAADVVKGEAGRIAEGDVCIYIHTYTYTYMYMCYVCVISCTCEWIASCIVF